MRSPHAFRFSGWLRAGLLVLAAAAVAGAGRHVSAVNPHAARRLATRGAAPFTESFGQMTARTRARISRAERLHPDRLPQEHEVRRHRSRIAAAAAPAFPPPSGASAMTPGRQFHGSDRHEALTSVTGAIYQVPPDTMGVIGPDHFVQTLNGVVSVYTRTGVRVGSALTAEFYSLAVDGVTHPNTDTSDPRVLYDRRSRRWYSSILELDPAGIGRNVILCVSRDANPLGEWDKYLLPVAVPDVDDNIFFNDYPTLGIDDNGVYIGINTFVLDKDGETVGVFGKMVATPKAPLAAAHPFLGAVWTFDMDDMFTPYAAFNQDPAGPGDPAWFVGNDPNAWGPLHFRTLTWGADGPELSDLGTVPTADYAYPEGLQAKGSTRLIDPLDDRPMGVTLRRGRLWTSRSVGVDQNGEGHLLDDGNGGIVNTSDRCGVEWFELDVTSGSATLAQTGRVYDPAPANPMSYALGTVNVNALGNAALAFTGVGPDSYLGVYYCSRLASDPPGAMSAVQLLRQGDGPYDVPIDQDSIERWGDYSATSVDPNDDVTFWTTQEFAGVPTELAPGTDPSSGNPVNRSSNWRTWISQIVNPAPQLNGADGEGAPGQKSVELDISGSGFWDPGAEFPNHPYAQLWSQSDPGSLSNFKLFVISPTQARLTFDIAPNAAPGPRDLIWTGADGQQARLEGAFTVQEPAGGVLAAPKSIQFGAVKRGGVAIKPLTLRNLSNKETLLVQVADPQPPFYLGEENRSALIPPGESYRLFVRFTPQRVGPARGLLQISSSDPKRKSVQVRLEGSGVNRGR